MSHARKLYFNTLAFAWLSIIFLLLHIAPAM